MVRLFGPAFANVIVPRALDCLRGSSGMFALFHAAETRGSPFSPNCVTKPGATRKKRLES